MTRFDREPKGIDRRFNPETQGRVSGGTNSRFHRERVEEVLDQIAPARHLVQGDTSDDFTGERFEGDELSIDNAAAYEEGRSDYDAGMDITGHESVLPCDLTGNPRDPKIGRSGRKTWFR